MLRWCAFDTDRRCSCVRLGFLGCGWNLSSGTIRRTGQMSKEPLKTQKRLGRWARLGLGAALVVSAPFVAGAVVLTCELIRLPNTAGQLAAARLSCAAMFAFGLSVGLIGSTLALVSSHADRRTLGCAATLFGCANIALGFMLRRWIEGTVTSYTPSVLQVLIPVTLWICSVWLAVRAARMESSRAAVAQQSTPEEQPQPLSLF